MDNKLVLEVLVLRQLLLMVRLTGGGGASWLFFSLLMVVEESNGLTVVVTLLSSTGATEGRSVVEGATMMMSFVEWNEMKVIF